MKVVSTLSVLATALLLSVTAIAATGYVVESVKGPEAGTSASLFTGLEDTLRETDDAADAMSAVNDAAGVHSFYFSRVAYGGGGIGRGSRWAVDYPQADHWFVSVLGRLTGIDVYPSDNVVRLDDPELRRYPFLYAVEVGSMGLSPAEVDGLRGYLLAGGFLMVDDFWGTYEWNVFEREMARVLPEYEIVDVPLEHPIFSTFYRIDEIIQVPAVNRAISGGPTWERDGYVPTVRGIFDGAGRLMVIINWNTDLGDAWEWAEEPRYPLSYSTYAYQVGANTIIYAMTR
jgi:hypothetical protein